ncbi:phage tail protein [Escherichia coli]
MSCSVWPGKNRYPIDVVKIPMAVPLTTAFKTEY